MELSPPQDKVLQTSDLFPTWYLTVGTEGSITSDTRLVFHLSVLDFLSLYFTVE